MNKIIGISGKAGVGKDTVADYILRQHKDCKKEAFADPVKRIAVEIFGFTKEQVYNQKLKEIVDDYWGVTPRKFLQLVGTDMFREVFRKDVWVVLFNKKFISSPHKITLVSDIRFQEEIDYIKSQNGIIINILRNHKSILSEESRQHKSEKSLFNENVLQHFNNYRTPYSIEKGVYHINNFYSRNELFENINIILENYL